MSETIVLQFYPLKGEGGGGIFFTKFYTGKLCPEVQPLSLLYTTLTKTVLLLSWLGIANDKAINFTISLWTRMQSRLSSVPT